MARRKITIRGSGAEETGARRRRSAGGQSFPIVGVGRKKLVLNGRRVTDDGKKTQWTLLAMEEVKG